MTEADSIILSAISDLRHDITQSAEQRNDALLSKIDEMNKGITARLDDIEDRVNWLETECTVRKDVYLSGKEFLRKPPVPFSETVSLYTGRGILILIGGVVMTYLYEIVKIFAKYTTRQ